MCSQRVRLGPFPQCSDGDRALSSKRTFYCSTALVAGRTSDASARYEYDLVKSDEFGRNRLISLQGGLSRGSSQPSWPLAMV